METTGLSKLWQDWIGKPSEAVICKNNREPSPELFKELSRYSHHKSLRRFLTPPPRLGADAGQANRWASSRYALLEVIKRLEGSCAPGSELEASLSHTTEASIVVGACFYQGARGIGVDLERFDRKISPGAAAKFVQDSELRLGLSPMGLWSIKEACFKANIRIPETIVAQYQVTSFDSELGKGEALHSPKGIRFEFLLVRMGEFQIAFARLTPPQSFSRET